MRNFASRVRELYLEKVKLDSLLDIITFTESPSGLGVTLYPAQRFILRVFYGLELKDNLAEDEKIEITDNFNEHVIHTFYSEIEFFNFLYAEKRINISYEDYREQKDLNQLNISEIVFICGRRASKTTLVAIITGYSLYILLSIEDPHAYFGILRSDPIGICLVSNRADNATKAYKAITDLIKSSKFFQRAIAGERDDIYWLKTEQFKTEEESGVEHSNKGNIAITSSAATSGVRGWSNIINVIDEIAHFIDSKTSKEKKMDEEIYEALVPSSLGFVDPESGRGYGKTFIMSSPNGKSGFLYKTYQDSFSQKDVLMVNVPSFWINRRLATNELKKIYKRSERSYEQEILAKFLDGQASWLSDINRLYACFDTAHHNYCGQEHPYRCYAGFDLGLVHDPSVLCIGHYQPNLPESYTPLRPELQHLIANDNKGYYIIDYIHRWLPEDSGQVDPDQLVEDLATIFNRFKIVTGSYDQFSHSLFTAQLKKRPNIKMEMEPATQHTNSDRAFLFKRVVNEGRLIIPHLDYVKHEFENLQEYVLGDQKIRIANDLEHDDIYSAMSRCVEHIHRGAVLKGHGGLVAGRGLSSPMLTGGRVLSTSNGRLKSTGNLTRDRMLQSVVKRTGAR